MRRGVYLGSGQYLYKSLSFEGSEREERVANWEKERKWREGGGVRQHEKERKERGTHLETHTHNISRTTTYGTSAGYNQ
jgi:hypothetical protein